MLPLLLLFFLNKQINLLFSYLIVFVVIVTKGAGLKPLHPCRCGANDWFLCGVHGAGDEKPKGKKGNEVRGRYLEIIY